MVIIQRQQRTVAELKLRYSDYSAWEVLTALVKDFGMRARTFMWCGELYTVKGALADIPSYLLDMQGTDFGVVRFYGGPVGRAKWYNGTILTMLCDAALFEMYSRKMVAGQRLSS